MTQLRLFPLEPRLSKSKFISGLQCHKRLYLEIHAPELATEVDEETQAMLDSGTEIGELARRLFSGGVLVAFDRGNVTAALRRTQELLADPRVPAIFEATFQFENVLVRVDVLAREPSTPSGEAWRLIEVKASTRVKQVHLEDLAIQAYVVTGAGLRLSGTWLMHLNRQYLYPGGALNLSELFVQRDLTSEVTARIAEVPTRLADMKAMLITSAPPEIQPGTHCHSPYGCPFWEHCTEDKSVRWVFYLPGGNRIFEKLLEHGIETIDEIPGNFPLSHTQQRMKDNQEWIGPELRAALQSLRHPIHHLDFETVMPAIPQYPRTRPYHALPFQWSNHIEEREGTLRHEEYLCAEHKDAREELAVRLLASLGRDGTICVYSGYEWRILMELAGIFPSLRRELTGVVARLWDLLPVVRRHYYHPQFAGSFSIKAVAPALAPELDYGNLEIQDGGMASLKYRRMVLGDADAAEQARIRAALLEYCRRDTLAMVEIRKALLQKAGMAPLSTLSMDSR